MWKICLHHFKIKISNKDIKINNILNSTSFNNLQRLELNQGFNESINENKFFAVGQKDQWKSELEQNQIKIRFKAFLPVSSKALCGEVL